ncbi:tRNA 2-selenouridine(34) synthase MnmH [Trinickia dinghuensis]|uniref:tRNA 2-selenouridine(34) synthase MnmH n=1 Tax=Trinickia dinghuensis TaxID=2291023 RepID=A0A3D8K0V2_9BURK|nr:tRNA 2-selenouridine(34) synthase MnmH [Trinickia dinghuensis]RDU98712.1 tRNA 2-selenouridine(34) synthase MnmH [Trinickia dinghuensis]
MKDISVSLDRLADFDEIVDVRTPLEFAEDHIPGAINAPVLDNEERVVVGTLYVQSSPFEATRIGAAMVARNIARHLETTFADRPRGWRPFVYCWRGGKRSESLAVWLNLMGWQARKLDGGYKTYRRSVLDTLAALPPQFEYIVLTGSTGSGKTRLLRALGNAGAQALDLEQLAAHRGSLLGAVKGAPQPSQKAFETALVQTLRGFKADRPVFIEAESRTIGRVALPDALLGAMHRSRCVSVQATESERIAFLLDDYAHLFEKPDAFKGQLRKLVGLHSHERVARWCSLIDANERAELFGELIALHYDPAYARSSKGHFVELPRALPFELRPNDADIDAQAKALLERLGM